MVLHLAATRWCPLAGFAGELYRKSEMVRLKAESGEHEDLVVPAGEVKVQGRVLYVIYPPAGEDAAGC